MKSKAPKLTFLEKKRLESHKNILVESKQKQTKRKLVTLSHENIAPKRFVTIKDRLLQEVKNEIFAVEPVIF